MDAIIDEDVVKVVIKIPRSTFELLQTVALSDHLRAVAEAAHGKKRKAPTPASVAVVIERLIQSHRCLLEERAWVK